MVPAPRVSVATVLTALVLGLIGLVGAPATAHTGLVASDPPTGARVARAPRVLTLEFSEAVDARLSTVALAIDGGAAAPLDVTTGASAATLVVRIPRAVAVRSSRPAVWRVAFRVVSADGHPVAGESAFTVRAAPASQDDEKGAVPDVSRTPEGDDALSPVASAEAGGDEFPWIPFLAGAAVLLLLLLAVAATVRLLKRDGDGLPR